MRLEARALSHHVPGPDGPRHLFRDLDLELAPGRLTAIVGPNGSGKTTLLRTLAGLLTPMAGTARLDGANLTGLPPRERARRLAYLPQTTPLVHDLSVRELVLLGRAPHLPRFGAPGDADRAAVDRAIDDVGLRAFADRGVFSLSGGEYQRVMLARMLATDARVLLLDEPTTALDVGHALGVLSLIRELAGQDRVVVAALHDLDLARRFSDDAICLHGDDTGACTTGPTPTVLAPDVLGPVFGVRVEDRDGVLSFFTPG